VEKLSTGLVRVILNEVLLLELLFGVGLLKYVHCTEPILQEFGLAGQYTPGEISFAQTWQEQEADVQVHFLSSIVGLQRENLAVWPLVKHNNVIPVAFTAIIDTNKINNGNAKNITPALNPDFLLIIFL